jgi:hypothetical protein
VSRVILHVGTHKTGSTSIQRTLNNSRADLLDLGIKLFEGSNHAQIHRSFIDTPEYFHRYFRSWNRDANQEQLKQKIKTYFLNHSELTHLVSSEDLSLLSEQSLSKLRNFLLDECKFSNITVVCFLRDPLDYLNSSLQQYIKPGLVTLNEILSDSFSSYRLQGFPDFHGDSQQILTKIYFSIPHKLLKIFGSDNTKFINFESATKVGLVHSLFSCFLHEDGEKWPKDTVFNVSMSHESCILLAEYNTRNPLLFSDYSLNTRRTKSRLVPVLRGISGRKPILINTASIDLNTVNNEIHKINALVGNEVMSPITGISKKYSEKRLLYFSEQAIENIVRLTRRSELQLPKSGGTLTLQDLENINRHLEIKYGKSWWQQLLNRE